MRNAAFCVAVSWCFQQWRDVQGLGRWGYSLAASGTHHLPVAQLHSWQMWGVVQLQILTDRKQKEKKGCVTAARDYQCVLCYPALQE